MGERKGVFTDVLQETLLAWLRRPGRKDPGDLPGWRIPSHGPGPSSVITKAVVEDFAKRFLEKPAVIWLSESRRHVVARDDALAQEIGLTIQPDKNLPDVILADLGPSEPLLVFVEVVATAGAISDARHAALMTLAKRAAFSENQVAFVTAYADRDESAFKASVSQLAWGSFAWFMSEPNNLLVLHRGREIADVVLRNLVRM